MALRKKKAAAQESEQSTTTATPTVDRLIALRRDITDKSAVTELIDILIEEYGGDASEVANQAANDDGTGEDNSTDVQPEHVDQVADQPEDE